jgi:hypothetical protein
MTANVVEVKSKKAKFKNHHFCLRFIIKKIRLTHIIATLDDNHVWK